MLDDTSYSDSLLDSSSSTIYGQNSAPSENLSVTSSAINTVDRDQMISICSHMCFQLQSIVKVLSDLVQDVCRENEASADLLHELQNKVQPFLETLDEEMTNSEKVTRSNLDNSRINEKKVEWLLVFHKLQLQMRSVLTEASGPIYDDISRILTLRHRGCSGVKLQQSTIKNLKEMKNGVDRTAEFLRQQRINANRQ